MASVSEEYIEPMLLRLSQVAEKVGRSHTTIRTWATSGKYGFPAPVVFGATGERRWQEEDINRWLEEWLNPQPSPPIHPVLPAGAAGE